MTEHDCGTELGQREVISDSMVGKTELNRDTVITSNRLTEIKTQSRVFVKLRSIPTCTSVYKGLVNNTMSIFSDENKLKHWFFADTGETTWSQPGVVLGDGVKYEKSTQVKNVGSTSSLKFTFTQTLSGGTTKGFTQRICYTPTDKLFLAKVMSPHSGGIATVKLQVFNSSDTLLTTSSYSAALSSPNVWMDIYTNLSYSQLVNPTYVKCSIHFNNTTANTTPTIFYVDKVELFEKPYHLVGVCRRCYKAYLDSINSVASVPLVGSTVTLPGNMSSYYSYLAASYSGSLVGIKPFSKYQLSARHELVSTMLHDSLIDLASEELTQYKGIPSTYFDYLDSIQDKLERALFILFLFGVYSSASA